jgi:hypothetical protein
MKIATLPIACIIVFSLSKAFSQASACTDFVRFEYSITNHIANLGFGEVRLNSLDPSQKIIWHLIPVNTTFEKKYIDGDVLKDVPEGEYQLIVRDQRPHGRCPVIKSIVIKK